MRLAGRRAAIALAALAALVALAVPEAGRARVASVATALPASPPAYGAGRVVQRGGHPEYVVDGKPFFMFGAAFFYDRIPRDRWSTSMRQLRMLGFNTLDLYVPWNWHELADGDFDFEGRTNPRRDLRALLQFAKASGFYLIVRPGPVIRNEWRNGGYPQWLLERPEYGMPLRDVLEGRYPATATLQNAHSDDAAAQWMQNGTHMRYARRWLERALHEFDPVADRVLAVALDDDQGAYIDNQTWPAPHLGAYLESLRATVTSVTGPRVPTFINTYQMKVPASSPVWAMGNWYQSDAYALGEHDRSQLEFSTALLQTRPKQPIWTSEFQAGWLLQPGDVVPQATDPANTTLALGTMLEQGVRGVVDFPAQDTLAPAGYEAPFSNAFYAWDAALPFAGAPTAPLPPRYAPTARFGATVTNEGDLLAATHATYDASIAWLGSAFPPGSLTTADYGALADRALETQRACRLASLACRFVDLRFAGDADLARSKLLVLPRPHDGPLAGATFDPEIDARLRRLANGGLRAASLVHAASVDAAAMREVARAAGLRPIVRGGSDATYAAFDDGPPGGFLSVLNYGTTPRRYDGVEVQTTPGRRVTLPPFEIAARSSTLFPVDFALRRLSARFGPDDRLTYATCELRPHLAEMDALELVRPDPVAPCRVRLEIHRVRRDLVLSSAGLTASVGGTAVTTAAASAGDAPSTPSSEPLVTARDAAGAAPRASAPPATTLAASLPVAPANATENARIPIARDTAFDAFGLPIVPAGRAAASLVDVYRDGFPCVVMQNDLVRVVVSPNAGGRSFVFEDLASGTSAFDSVGAFRDDVAIPPPLSTSDRIAKYTHQFPAGFFNRPYAIVALESGPHALVTLRYVAPDADSGRPGAAASGATFTRTFRLEPHARDLVVDETAVFDAAALPEQHGVAISSLAVGDPRAPTMQRVLPEDAALAPVPPSDTHVLVGRTAGLYDLATHEAILVTSSGTLRHERQPAAAPHMLLVTADLARAGTTRTVFRYDRPTSLAAARAELAAMRARMP